MKRYITLLLSFILIISMLAGCSSKDDGFDFIYPFNADVNSYDPQVASTSDEFLIIENTFEGLIRVLDDGTVQPGMADTWEISDDGLTYTFHIRNGMKWDINTDKYESGDDAGKFKDQRLEMMGKEFNPDITAEDFVFALRRAVSPETNSPMFATISAIKNANAIHNGYASASTLGIEATNPNLLTITLERKDDSFMEALSSAIAMPCNEEFFNATKGRYGLSTKYTLFNGQFYVSQILESSYLLKANQRYTGEYPTKAKELTLKILDEDSRKAVISKLESGYYDAAFISGHDSDAIKESSGISYVDYQDTTWAFILNPNDEALQSKWMRAAFCEGFSTDGSFGKDYLATATSLIPSSCVIGGEDAVSLIGKTSPSHNQSESVKDWKEALGILGTTSISVTVIAPEYMENTTKMLLQGIQGGMGSSLDNNGSTIDFTLKLETKTEGEIKNAIATGEYDIALVPFKATSNNPINFLNDIASSGYGEYDSEAFDSHIRRAQSSSNPKDIANSLRLAEKEIISSYTICPVVYEKSYYASAKGVSNIQFHTGTGRVSFINATR